MKSLILSCFISLLCLTVSAQSLFVLDADTYVSAPASVALVEADITVQNNTASTVSFMVSRNMNLTPGHSSYFCWSLCYDSTVDVSQFPLSLTRNQIDSSSFHSYLTTNGVSGVSSVEYKFYNEIDPTDFTVVTLVYDITTTGIPEYKNNEFLSDVSPNPSFGLTSISLKNQADRNGRIIISDMTGKVAKEIQIQGANTILFDVSDLTAGTYFCSLVNNGQTKAVKKLLVINR